MPFAANYMTEEEEKKNQDQNGGVNVSGTSTSFATNVPGQNASNGSTPQKGSGDKFANIQSYLSANEQQGNQMGQKITGDVSNEAEAATQKLNEFEQKAPKVDEYDPTEVYNNVTSLTDQQKQAYKTAKAGYSGPQTLDQVEGYQDTQKAVSSADQKVENAKSEEGQRELLKQTYKKPSYTAGQNALDQTLVQNSGDSRKAFEDLTQKYSGLGKLFDDKAEAVGTSLNNAVKTGLANQQKITAGDAAAKSALIDPIKARAEAQNASSAQRINSVQADIMDEILSEDTMKALGLSEGQKLWDLNLSNYFLPDRTVANANNVATADERNRYQALTDLIDGKAGSEITMDGKQINPLSFDAARFAADQARKQAEFDAYASGANFTARTGSGGPKHAIDGTMFQFDGQADANLASYLADPNSLVGRSVSPRFTEMVADQNVRDAQNYYNELARQNVLAQIQQALESQKYNRMIKKG